MHMVKIMLDSSSDSRNTHPCDYYIPLTVDIGGRAYKDGVDLRAQKFYRLLTTTAEFPKTSQPSPEDFMEAFSEVKEQGDQLIYITVSAALSGTYQSANIAKSMAEYDEIYIVDSGAASHMIGMLAHHADQLRSNGLSAPEIVEALQKLRQRQVLYAGLQTLEYLQKGGRLSKTSAAVGTIANIKPIISISADGKVESFAKAIGVKRAIATIVKQVQSSEIDTDFPVWSLCTVDDANCEALETALMDAGIPVAGRMQVGPTIGAHVGPGVYGVTYVRK
jgi:DegV family protein with EDD domain